METIPQPTQENRGPSPLGRLRFDVIEAQTEKLLPWADEMAGNDYIISVDDAKSVVEATVWELNNREMFVESPNFETARELIDQVVEILESDSTDVNLTRAVDTTLALCTRDKLLNKKILKEE